MLKRSWLLLTVLQPSQACFPSSTLRPCCPSLERTMSGFKSSSREALRKRPPLRRRSQQCISAPAFPLSMKQALTSSTATTPPLPGLRRHRSTSIASGSLNGSPSDRCINMWHRRTPSVQLMVGQQVSHLRLWQCPRTLTRGMSPRFPLILHRPTLLGPHQLQGQSRSQQQQHPKYQ